MLSDGPSITLTSAQQAFRGGDLLSQNLYCARRDGFGTTASV
jgi:hypothetical protein